MGIKTKRNHEEPLIGLISFGIGFLGLILANVTILTQKMYLELLLPFLFIGGGLGFISLFLKRRKSTLSLLGFLLNVVILISSALVVHYIGVIHNLP
ncbi:hypothetical protein ABE236_06600 [Priestia endophytica]|jgi:hypothetical protein|uniref:hypothetical protein n=1 Tax=Priestia endophytica TaxID=135735 RepID=UPI003D27F390